jgi:hypothetical protein
MNFRLLRKFCIYRIQYFTPKTNFRPLIFVLYAGAFKVHALSINAPAMSTIDVMQFVSFIRRMRTISNIDDYTSRVMYRILRSYYPNIVRKTYRTYFTTNIGAIALISYGLLKDKSLLTPYELAAYNKSLLVDGNNIPTARIINISTGTKYTPAPKAPIYQPPKTDITNDPKNVTQTKEETAKTTPPINKTAQAKTPVPPNKINTNAPQNPENKTDAFSIYGED